jgi:hypothetical protein
LIALPCGPSISKQRGNADVLFVWATETSKETWTFKVKVTHPDTGWKDYANGWDVVLPDGTVVKNTAGDKFTRELYHPHETEQPFTRGQSGLKIPATVKKVTVRAHDLVDGFGGQEVIVDLTQSQDDYFKVRRLND